MLQALVHRGIRPDTVYGASVGAINAAGFAGDPTIAGVEHMATLWRAVTREDVFPQGRFPTPWRFFQQREAVFSNEGVRGIIQSGLRFERIEDSPVHLEVVATSLTDGRTQWFTRGPAEDAILASAALPALLPPVAIDGEVFIDGGVTDNVPIGRAIAAGARRLFVLLCGPMHYTPQPARRPVEAVLTAFFIAVHTRFARELRHLAPGVEVVVFTVDNDPISRYDDFSGTEALITAGRANAEQVLDFWESGRVGDSAEEPLRAVAGGEQDDDSAAV
jgi:NTE family protein